jgi:hypothetical protein
MKKPIVFILGLVVGVLATLATLYLTDMLPSDGQGYILKEYDGTGVYQMEPYDSTDPYGTNQPDLMPSTYDVYGTNQPDLMPTYKSTDPYGTNQPDL